MKSPILPPLLSGSQRPQILTLPVYLLHSKGCNHMAFIILLFGTHIWKGEGFVINNCIWPNYLENLQHHHLLVWQTGDSYHQFKTQGEIPLLRAAHNTPPAPSHPHPQTPLRRSEILCLQFRRNFIWGPKEQGGEKSKPERAHTKCPHGILDPNSDSRT